jgi:hypothetical protein
MNLVAGGIELLIGGFGLLKKLPRAVWIVLAAVAIIFLGVRWHNHRVDVALQRADNEGFNRAKRQFEKAQQAAAELQRKKIERIEKAQDKISHERSADYEKDRADIRRRADLVRVRQQARADQGRSSGGTVPGVPDAAGEPDGAAFADTVLTPDQITSLEQAELNTAQLIALQQWIRDQQALHEGAN